MLDYVIELECCDGENNSLEKVKAARWQSWRKFKLMHIYAIEIHSGFSVLSGVGMMDTISLPVIDPNFDQ